MGPTGYFVGFFKADSGTSPRLRMFLWNFAFLRSAKRLDVVCKSHKAIDRVRK